MKFLLDTCAVSDYLRGVEPVVHRIQKVRPSDVGISAVTVMELRYGAARRQSPKLTASVEAFLSGISILTFDAEAAVRAGVLRASMETKGYSIALADCQIAGTALAYDLTLVTNDSDLLRVPGLKVADWRLSGRPTKPLQSPERLETVDLQPQWSSGIKRNEN